MNSEKPINKTRMKDSSGKPGPKYKKATDGFILVDKPKGITSFDVIRELRKILNFKKMGHLGTLDPNATGLLPVCTGRATRLSQFLLHGDKRYRAIVRLGMCTDTYDAKGEPTSAQIDPPEMTQKEIEKILGQFLGNISQIPPEFSAKKIAGKRSYQLAREGKEVNPKPCEVRIDEITLLRFEKDVLEFEVTCSAGMYVRSLAHDIGAIIGCGAYLEDLSRLQVGELYLDDAFTLDQIDELAANGNLSFIKPMHEMLPDFKRIEINDGQVARIKHGGRIVLSNQLLANGELLRLFNDQGNMIAIARVEKPLGSMQIQVLPKTVFN